MADDQLNMRIDPELKKNIQDLVDAKKFKDITSFVEIAIRNELDIPQKEREIKEIFVKFLEGSEFRNVVSRIFFEIIKKSTDDTKRVVYQIKDDTDI
jgi:Arc/MetJ-type ribon-helix-helix transcriptional regulator